MLVLAVLSCMPRPWHVLGNVHMINGNHCKYWVQLENFHHLFKVLAQMHLIFHCLHIQIQARHMDCVLIPADWGLMGLGVSKQVQMSVL